MQNDQKKFKIALLCGGPSLERAVSLNSARTVLDHLSSDEIEILPVYFDHKKKPYLISRAQLYSNTPSDFDFKLKQTARPLTQKQLIGFLKRANLVFPAMHGRFGEDGTIQKFLEKTHLPFIGSPSAGCALAYDKYLAGEFIKQKGFYTLPSLVLFKKNYRRHKTEIAKFFSAQSGSLPCRQAGALGGTNNKITRAIVKPARGGSSLGVYQAASVAEAMERAQEIFSKKIDDRAIIEPFCSGKEFTVIILENKSSQPVAILPTEIEILGHGEQIFDYRKKYLATRQVAYHCPPRFAYEIIFKIQNQAQELFRLFGLRDFARFDGWMMPDGQIWFSDFNPISGMEQNSFLFMQSSRLGMSHRDFLSYIIKNACRRQKINFPENNLNSLKLKQKKQINVIFGGQTAERQVSVMSGTNVWLKLRQSAVYDPRPYLLDLENNVWQLPYALTLYHTVDEIAEVCRAAKPNENRLQKLTAKVVSSLQIDKQELTEPWFLPEKMTLKEFINRSPYIFIGLHGGAGENGVLQSMLEQAKKPFNGSGSVASKLCMDKFATGLALAGLEKQGIYSAKKKVAELNSLKKLLADKTCLKKYWQALQTELGSASIIVKPIDDGCSAGIARLYNAKDLKTYLNYALFTPLAKGGGGGFIPAGELTGQHGIVEMPSCPMEKIMFEKFITTDKAQVAGNKLKWTKNTGWIEVTIGLLESGGKLRAFNPSLTVAIGNVLTLEEKFQGGTGVNITPPPAPYVKPAAVKAAKIKAEKVAKLLGLAGYARIDAFMNVENGELIIIEANTLPGLTPSTVIYQQALAETPSLYPKEFLEKIIYLSFPRRRESRL